MKKAIIAGLLTACFCNFSFGSHENNPLGAAGMFIRTGDDNKDTNTSFTVELWTKDGQTLIAYLRSVEACPRGCEYPKGLDKNLLLTVNALVTKKEAEGFVVKWCYEPQARDDWDIAMSLLQLDFSEPGTDVVVTMDRASGRQRFTNKMEGSREVLADAREMLAGFCKIY
jgi:hypothetical protein